MSNNVYNLYKDKEEGLIKPETYLTILWKNATSYIKSLEYDQVAVQNSELILKAEMGKNTQVLKSAAMRQFT